MASRPNYTTTRQLSLQFPTDSTEALICAVAHQILAPWAKLAEG